MKIKRASEISMLMLILRKKAMPNLDKITKIRAVQQQQRIQQLKQWNFLTKIMAMESGHWEKTREIR